MGLFNEGSLWLVLYMFVGCYIIDLLLLYLIMFIKSEIYDLDGKENIVVKMWNCLYINDFFCKNIKGYFKVLKLEKLVSLCIVCRYIWDWFWVFYIGYCLRIFELFVI